MRLLDLDEYATAHHGLITRAHGALSADAWLRAVRGGHLEQLHPGVARLPGTPRTAEQRIAAGVLAAGPGAMASHRSAARLWGVSRPDDDPVDIITASRTSGRLVPSAVVHRPRDRARLLPARRLGIACTNPLRTLLDLGAVDPASVSGAVGHFLTCGTLGVDAVEAALAEHARRGRAGVVALRSAVDEWVLDGKPADSVLEPAMRRLEQRYALPAMTFHPVIEGCEVDFRVHDTILIVECDGWKTHGLDRRTFERDRLKDDDLRAAGWIVIRFTYRAIVRRPGDTARRIRRAIDRWGHVTPPD